MPFPNPNRPPNSGNKPGKAIVRDPEEKRLRALRMLEMRIGGAMSYQAIADEFNVSIKTVKRVFSYAKKANLIGEAEDKILDELVPAAHGALKRALEDKDNTQLAGQLGLKIMEGALPGFGKKNASKVSVSDPNDSLAKAIAEARELYADALDGELVGESQGTLPPAAEAAADARYPRELYLPNPAGDGNDALGTPLMGKGEREGNRSDAVEGE